MENGVDIIQERDDILSLINILEEQGGTSFGQDQAPEADPDATRDGAQVPPPVTDLEERADTSSEQEEPQEADPDPTRDSAQVPPPVMDLEGRADTSSQQEQAPEADPDAPWDSAQVPSPVTDLEGQADTSFRHEEVPEADVDATQRRPSEELADRAESEALVEPLEARAAAADRLRENLAFVEGERNRFADSLAESRLQLETATRERDSLAERAASVEVRAKELEGRNTALEMSLAEAHEAARRLRGEVEDLREKLASNDGRTADLRADLQEQMALNNDLVVTRERLESEIKALSVDHEVTRNRLEASRKALRVIRSEIALTAKRVQQRYFGTGSADPPRRGGAPAGR